jgi:hypothetical protein
VNAAEGQIHQGLDGWLFLTGGANYVTALYDRENGHLPDKTLQAWRRLLEKRAKKCNALGIRYAHVVVPDKLTIYGHKQSASLVDPDLAPALRLGRMLSDSPAADAWVDLVAPLREERDGVDLYWQTDTHWTPEGCMLAYGRICAQLGLTPNADPHAAPRREFAARMDLGVKLDPARWEQVVEYDFSGQAQRIFINRVGSILENPDFGAEIHVGSRSIYENRNARNNAKIILYGDSYAGQRANFLTGLLAETTKNVEFVWSSDVDWRHVKKTKPDILITEIAERFMTIVPRDRLLLRGLELRQMLRARRRQLSRWLALRRSAF